MDIMARMFTNAKPIYKYLTAKLNIDAQPKCNLFTINEEGQNDRDKYEPSSR